MIKKILLVLATLIILMPMGLVEAVPETETIDFVSAAGIPFESLWHDMSGSAVEVTSIPGAWTSISGATWIWSESPVSGGRNYDGDVVQFTQKVDLGLHLIITDVLLEMDISADNEYKVYFNGQMIADSGWTLIGDGETCPKYEDDREYETVDSISVDVTEYATPGMNTLMVEVLNLPCYTTDNPGGAIWSGTIEYTYDDEVDIDIKPGSDPNAFNINDHGVIPVAILGSENFDVYEIDPETVIFAGLEVRVKGKGPKCAPEDVNSDGYMDLVCQFEDVGDDWEAGEGTATLTGELYDGTPFYGSDTIKVVPE